MKCLIAGDGKAEKRLAELLLQVEEIDIVAYMGTGVYGNITSNVTDDNGNVCSLISYKAGIMMYRRGEIDAILLIQDEKLNADTKAHHFLDLGVSEDAILYVSQNYDITPYFKRRELASLEYQTADNCNMNCVSCSHYSNLVKGSSLADLESTRDGLLKLKGFVDNICLIRILGGEPLLHPDLADFILMTREIYPGALLEVVSNGLLITKMSDRLIDAFHSTKAVINISFYPAMKDKMPETRRFLDRTGITYRISPEIVNFYKVTDLSGMLDPKESYRRCSWKFCTMLRENRLAVCSFAFMTRFFNEYFGAKLPESGSFSLDEPKLTSEKIMRRLYEPIDFCRFCRQPGEQWPWKRGSAGCGSLEDIVVNME